MNRPLNEQLVLKKLGINSFRQLSKKKVLKLASMIHEMDPEVAKKALEQFPEFEKTTLELVEKYHDSFKTLLESSKNTSEKVFDMHEHAMCILEKELDADSLSFEQRMAILDRITDINIAIREMRREIAQEQLVAFISTGVATVAGIVAAAAVLGVKLHLPKGDDDAIDDDDIDEYEEV